MSYVLLAVGIAIALLAYRGSGNVKEACSLLYEEMFGAKTPFWEWCGSLIVIGSLGYIPEMEGFATAFLVLILCGIILSHKSGFKTLIEGL